MTGPGHSHGASRAGRGRALGVSLGLNSVLLVLQVAGALAFGSLALMADSAHQASDVVSLVVAMVAFRLAARAGSSRYTYGLRRAEVIGALLNAVLLLVAAGWIVVEAIRRFGDTAEINGGGVVALALAGMIVNGGSAWWLARVAGDNLNLRGAMIHLLADAAGSVAVLVSGVAIVIWDATWTDPVLSLFIAGLVIWQGVTLILATGRVFLEATPDGVDLAELDRLIDSDDEVVDVHHLHVWALDSETVALTAHVRIAEQSLHDAQEIAGRLESRLAEVGIHHTTLALECHDCEPGAEVC
jgi:cobalt-zinc-cadmium efflux system protein